MFAPTPFGGSSSSGFSVWTRCDGRVGKRCASTSAVRSFQRRKGVKSSRTQKARPCVATTRSPFLIVRSVTGTAGGVLWYSRPDAPPSACVEATVGRAGEALLHGPAVVGGLVEVGPEVVELVHRRRDVGGRLVVRRDVDRVDLDPPPGILRRGVLAG